jgi:hypothetical protein
VSSHHHPKNCECQQCELLNCIHRDLIRILKWIALKEIDFVQVGGSMNIVRGTGGTFTAVLTPTNGAQAAGTTPQWGADDPSIVLTPSADGLSCQANAPTGSTVTSFNLSVKATSSDPTVGAAGVVSATHPVTVSEPTPPPPTALQSIDFVQTAG